MGLRDTLEKHNIPIPEDFDERLDIIVAGLKRKSNYKQKLEKFKKHRGGAEPAPVAPPLIPDSEDYLGPRLRWFLSAMTTPYARTMLQGLFMIVFFLSYLEKIPIFGSILSASLDVILAGGKTLVKSVQSILPAAIGVIPLPYASMVGIAMAAIFGMTIWPIFSIISLSRQDFVAAVESYIRIIPPPIGDMLANTFLEGNRAVARIDEKRIKLGNDISNGLSQISQLATTASSTMKEGFLQLAKQTQEAASTARNSMPAMPTMPTVPAMPTMPTMPTVPTAPPSTESQQVEIPVAPVAPPKPMSALERLRSQKTGFTAPKLTKGGFHRRTRRRAWRTKTQRKSEKL
jgi:hypothetical protein